MPNRIRVLDERVINRIAAGEVVERPVSVVKELLENSIDAGATSVRVDIEAGGKRLIRVRDNGSGMSHDDAFLALERHATSKLKSETDLDAIVTMGFRGEALASIAAVSQLRLVTREASEPEGTEILVEGGVLKKTGRLGTAPGSLIEVRNLFFNVAVRRKFIRSDRDEGIFIREFVQKMALAYPGIGFAYSEEKKVRWEAPAVAATYERIPTLFPRELHDKLVAVDYANEHGRLTGFLARPPYETSSRREVYTFVNGRPIKDRVVNAAVRQAFLHLVDRNRYPFAILFIELPPDSVDVNVHPQKAEVRFTRPNAIFGLIVDGVHQALLGEPFKPPRDTRDKVIPRPPTSSLSRHLEGGRPATQPLPWDIPEPAPAPSESSPPQEPQQAGIRGHVEPGLPRQETYLPPDAEPAERARGGGYVSLGILGRLPGSFLVLYSDTELLIMDHHAAHERVLFEALLKADREGERPEIQSLLIPTVLEYSALEARAFARYLDLLQQAGFDIAEFGRNDFAVKGVPAWLGNVDLPAFFAELVDLMLDTGLRGDPKRLRDELLKTMACRAAVKESAQMQPEEIRALLRELDRLGAVEVCPHGRPLLLRFPYAELRRKMGRK